MLRFILAGLAAITGALIPAGPAAAHTSGPPATDAPYYIAEITGVTPPVAGLAVRVDEHGDWIEVTNTGPRPVIVLGYFQEPYLRVALSLTEENTLSQSAYLNRSLFGDTMPTGQSGGAAQPVWKRVSPDGRARWHDHRTHWMGAARPPAVAADPTRPHPIGTWALHLTAGSQPVTVEGTLRWTGRPASDQPGPWSAGLALGTAAATAGMFVVVVVAVRVRRKRARPAAARPILD